MIVIFQGVCQLLEPKIFIRCREQDQELVQSVIPSAVASVKPMIKMETDVQLDTEGFLPANRYENRIDTYFLQEFQPENILLCI